MKFRYLIVNLYVEEILGTNNIEKTVNFSKSTDYIVIDNEKTKFIVDGEHKDILELN